MKGGDSGDRRPVPRGGVKVVGREERSRKPSWNRVDKSFT